MIVRLFVLLGALTVVLWSVSTYGPVLNLPLICGAIGCVLGVILLLQRLLRRKTSWVVVDGSNVLYWDKETPRLETVRLALDLLQEEGFAPILWFDANVGYLVADRYMGPDRLARALGYPKRRIFVAPKGTPADPLLIEDALKLGVPIVSNDRFRDWSETYPPVAELDRFMRGTFRGDVLQLTLPG